MIHPRTQLRKAIFEAVKSFVDKGISVQLTRPSNVSFDELPLILIYFENETERVIVGNDYFPKNYERTLTLNVDVIAEGEEDPDTFLDRISFQVESAFHLDPLFEKKCYGCRLVSVKPITISDTGERAVECQRLTYNILYQSDAYLAKRKDDFLSFDAPINEGTEIETTIREK